MTSQMKLHSFLVLAFFVTIDGFLGSTPTASGTRHPAGFRIGSRLSLRMASENGLAEAAAAAMKAAEEAQARADSLKSELVLQKQKKAEIELRAVSPGPATATEEPMMDADLLAKEMSEMLSGLQARGQDGRKDPLAGTRWALDLDFGREKGTWMDARGLVIEFGPGGQVVPVQQQMMGTFGVKKGLGNVRGGTWNVEGKFPQEKVKFFVDHDGFTTEETGCDIDLPPGRLFLSANTMGGKLGRQGGMSIEQRRFYVRLERRMVGTYTHTEIKQ